MKKDIEKYISVALAILTSIVAAFSLSAFDEEKLNEILFDNNSILISIAASVVAAMVSYFWYVSLREIRNRKVFRQVYIIYAREDAERANNLALLLRNNNFEPWLDVEKINAGEIWRDVSLNALSESAMAIALISENFAKSDFAKKELEVAINRMTSDDKITSPVIPVVYDEESVPSDIKRIQYVDMSKDNAEEYLISSVGYAIDKIIKDRKVSI